MITKQLCSSLQLMRNTYKSSRVYLYVNPAVLTPIQRNNIIGVSVRISMHYPLFQWFILKAVYYQEFVIISYRKLKQILQTLSRLFFFFFWNLNNTSYMYSKIQNINACQQSLASWFSKRSTKIWKYIWCLKWGKITFLSFKVQLLANLAIPIGVLIFLQVLWGLRTLLAHKTITVYQ